MEGLVVGSRTLSLCPVALLLDGGEGVEWYVDHVLLRPHHSLVIG